MVLPAPAARDGPHVAVHFTTVMTPDPHPRPSPTLTGLAPCHVSILLPEWEEAALSHNQEMDEVKASIPHSPA